MDAVLLESLGVAAVTVAACVARGTASLWPALLRRAGNDYLQQHGQSCVGRSTRSEPAALREWVVSVAVGVRWVVSVEVGDAQAFMAMHVERRTPNGPTKGEHGSQCIHARSCLPFVLLLVLAFRRLAPPATALEAHPPPADAVAFTPASATDAAEHLTEHPPLLRYPSWAMRAPQQQRVRNSSRTGEACVSSATVHV
jgi:hypothetical protein